jgi:hypothetical protein
MGFEVTLDETGEQGVAIKRGGKIIRTGTRFSADEVRREQHDDRESAQSAHDKNKQGLRIQAKTEARGWTHVQLCVAATRLIKPDNCKAVLVVVVVVVVVV